MPFFAPHLQVVPRLGRHMLRWAAPQALYRLAGRLAPWCAALAAALAVVGLAIGLLVAPSDAQQGDAYRIVLLHEPAAWMSLIIYLSMAFWSGVGLILHTQLTSMFATALAPSGALMTLVALWSGALWGKPTWGTWWVWDARLTAELLLLVLYVGFLALHAATDNSRRAERVGAVLSLIGAVNVPVTYYSVQWWNSLQQGASGGVAALSGMAGIMVAGMGVMLCAFWAYAFATALYRVRSMILEREKSSAWVRELMEVRA